MTVQSKSAARPDSVTTGPIAGSRKIYTSPEGRPDIRVPFREIALDPSAREEPYRAYDTSGPFTDPAVDDRPRRRPGPGPQHLDRRARLRHAFRRATCAPRTTATSAPSTCSPPVPPSTRSTAGAPASPSPSTNSPAPGSSRKK